MRNKKKGILQFVFFLEFESEENKSKTKSLSAYLLYLQFFLQEKRKKKIREKLDPNFGA